MLLDLFRLDSKHVLVNWLFLRGLALIYLAAFISIAGQIQGLIGAEGILPINEWLAVLTKVHENDRFWLFPTVFWIDGSDWTLRFSCALGITAALLLLFNKWEKTALIACYILYLSITVAGQDFTAFQWDVFLLEAGFMGIFLAWGSEWMVWLYRLLIARFMFMGGLVKIVSGDPSWANFTALNYHYLTQPLPSPVAYYAFFLPSWFHQFCVALVFFIELVVPFGVFLPRPFRIFSAWSFIVLQSTIILTGNYNFFNLLTILLCLMLFDDQDFKQLLPGRLIRHIVSRRPYPGLAANITAASWGGVVLMACALSIGLYHGKEESLRSLAGLSRVVLAFAVVNNYGPFAVMTTERRELVIEGSNDGIHWLPYYFRYKPVELDRKLSWNIPHQPRLDWQLWFAALEAPEGPMWFGRFLTKLKKGSPGVLSLLGKNPFPEGPPRLLRAALYRYTFNSPELRRLTGRLWKREYLGIYRAPS